MIKSVMFDMGQVLFHFNHRRLLDRLDLPEEDKQLLLREVLLSVEWIQIDRGTLDEAMAEAQMQKRLPERLHPAIHALCFCWNEPLELVSGMYELISELKENGYGIYLLSNTGRRYIEYWEKIPASRFFDGTVISADLGVMKPHPDIYRHALQKFGLSADEVFFVDDSPTNVEGARYCGIPGAVFHGDVRLLRKALHAAGVTVLE